MNKIKIGFIGQGWIGKNYADDFEKRGFDVVRYSQEDPYIKNKGKIKDCDIVFIAVPTPTTPSGFDLGIVKKVIKLVGKGRVVVLKSTILPGSTEMIQKENPSIYVMHSPEFLTETTAAYDAAKPKRNIIGYVHEDGRKMANFVMKLLPDAPYKAVVPAKVAELIKYGGNCWFYFKVVFINMLYDLARELGVDYEMVKDGMSFDPRIGFTHLEPIHKSGRGAGGKCFIKDFAAFSKMYNELLPDDFEGKMLLSYMENKNVVLLKDSKKDLYLLEGVYGKHIKNDMKNVKKLNN